MCGICLRITKEELRTDFKDFLEITELEVQILRKRGPDSFEICSRTVETDDGISYVLDAAASVLFMRGEEIVVQPLENENGDFLLFNGEIYGGFELQWHQNDTRILLENLSKFTSDEEILRFVSNLRGPRSFIYFNNNSKKLWLSRDSLGRCSLLWYVDENETFFSSAKPPNFTDGQWREMPAGVLICIDFAKPNEKTDRIYSEIGEELAKKYRNVTSFELYSNENLLKINENLIEVNEFPALIDDDSSKIMMQLLGFYEIYVDAFLNSLRNVVRQRLDCVPKRRECPTKPANHDAKLAVLFSGGVDSLLLAAVCDEIWPITEPIDLLNVAFEQSSGKKFNVPDRRTGAESLSEMKRLRAKRVWNFVQIDVTQEELKTKRKETIANLLHPNVTVLDDSIGCALWFAARGHGTVDGRPYQSRARALFVGSGADELLAGYSRHRQRFAEFGWSGLLDELKMELRRLPYRNLGRDDRVIADHGREPHAPYLDEAFVVHCNSLPIHVKTNLNLPRGIGEKLILRLSLWRLGFRKSALEPKRAMQFGTRIAKSENRKERGGDACIRLTS